MWKFLSKPATKVVSTLGQCIFIKYNLGHLVTVDNYYQEKHLKIKFLLWEGNRSSYKSHFLTHCWCKGSL